MWRAKLYMLVAYGVCVSIFGLDLLDSYTGGRAFSKVYLDTLPEWGAVYAFILFSTIFSFDSEKCDTKGNDDKRDDCSELALVVTEVEDRPPDTLQLSQGSGPDTERSAVVDEKEGFLEVVVTSVQGDDHECEEIKENSAPKAKRRFVESVTPNAVLATYFGMLFLSIVGFLGLRQVFSRH